MVIDIKPKDPILNKYEQGISVPVISYDDNPSATVPRAFVMDFIKRTAHLFKGNVLDIGVGKWDYPRKFFSHCNYITLEKDLNFSPNVFGDIYNLPFKTQSLHGILCNQVFEHIPDPFKAMAEIDRLLKEDSYLLITTPYLYALHGDNYWRPGNHAYRDLLNPYFSEVTLDWVGHRRCPYAYGAICRK